MRELLRSPKTRAIAGNIAALAFGIVLAGTAGEVALRIYNPVRLPLRGRKIVLPTHKHFVFELPPRAGIDPIVHVTENSLGFRGPEPPGDLERALTIVTVGGSTTECRYLTDEKTWPAVLAKRLSRTFPDVWINNAGLDGHSTFGHIALFEQVLRELHPKYLLFLIGINDVGHGASNDFDVTFDRRTPSLVDRVVEWSELLSTLVVFYRSARAVNLGVGHYWSLDLEKNERVPVVESELARKVEEHRASYLPGFEARLLKLVELTREAGIEPIFVTQPALFGEGKDPATGVELGPLAYRGESAAERWRVLEAYNEVTRVVASREHVFTVDLARELSKDSRYFYDWMHFTNEGAARVAELLETALVPRLRAAQSTGGTGTSP